MTLSRVLRADAVLVGFNPKDKWEAIRRLVERLAEVGAFAAGAQEAVHEALLMRERSMSTGMERGVAIPHAAVDAIDRPVAALAILPRGVGFESIDGRPATIVALLVIPRREKLLHIRTLAEVARLLSRDELRARLLSAQTPEEVLVALRAEEAKEGGAS
ncbi:MAG TPA: PTS sugar transporter subunit IIA [Planctomycetota bacterium]|jgi:mannitol/fructose-specific phosphotransferase system IIA component (Ntr-type)|nr:PTS sugar transporter subunit IIA [Planctomycetota bacterium]